ncbi:AraC family transcriptional regulator [Sphingomonas sp. 28-63-12]|uniref:AraC family transcriptional regulator n=1 Tax=Sphingomonas sp. 28-63-12 TaxID=1970434 RepID=UPI000BC5A0F6|nr:MAG: hypothetical protein B7Y47_14115 [Sphingomonas sp. 28-63-12]
MAELILDRLLMTLDVAVDAFAICEVNRGLQLVARPGDEIEVHYVLSGTMYLTVPGQSPIICGPGSIVLVPPHTAQTIGADELPGRQLVAMEHCSLAPNGMVRFDGTGGDDGELRFVCGLITANISGSFGLLDTVRKPIVENLGDLPIVQTSYELMAAELARADLGSRALTGALMKACVLLLLRRHFGRSDHETSLLSTLRDPRLGKAVTAVLDKPASRHSVAALASIAGMSRSAFAREFSQAFSMSPMEFVAKTRLHHAAEMLRSTNMPVKVIAAHIGFSSRSHFSRAFRDGYGADPSSYRRETAQGGRRDPVRREVAAERSASSAQR